MNQELVIRRTFRVDRQRRGRKMMHGGLATTAAERVPRISRLMALAIHFDRLLRDGLVESQAELARLGHVSRARLTQIMNLTQLAPEIQEELLFLQPERSGQRPIRLQQMQQIAGTVNWQAQRQILNALF